MHLCTLTGCIDGRCFTPVATGQLAHTAIQGDAQSGRTMSGPSQLGRTMSGLPPRQYLIQPAVSGLALPSWASRSTLWQARAGICGYACVVYLPCHQGLDVVPPKR